jgi:hypothetical protein
MRGHCFDLGGYHGRVIRSVNLFHYMLFFLVTHPRDAGDIGHALNEFEQRQLVEWTPKAEDFLKHDDENRTHDGVFGRYRGEDDNYGTCVFPGAAFTRPYDAECVLLKPADGMRLLDLDADQAPRPIILPAGAASKSCA